MFILPERPDPSDFTTVIDNPFLPLIPGTTLKLGNRAAGEEVSVRVTHRTKIVDGVECVVVRDTERTNGLVAEDTFDWFAQDSEGNVWYFGEATRSFDPLDPEEADPEGSWEAGVDGARPGIVMFADPEVGQRYFQEFAPDVAEDKAVVQSLSETVHVGYGSFDEALRTRDINPLDPSSELKFYAEGVGFLLAVDEDGEREELLEMIVRGRAGDDVLDGYAGGDRMVGRAGDDALRGLAGNDTMLGGVGDDTLSGGTGFDKLNGGRGDDVLVGGPGGDTFVIRGLGNGRADTDTIADYRAAQLDTLALPGGAGAVVSEAEMDGVWQLTLAGDGDIVRLPGVEDAEGDGSVLNDILLL